jgi:hypothetical protein
MNRIFAALLLVFIAGSSTPGFAKNLSSSKLFGRWCGAATSYIFTRERLTVVWNADGRRRSFVIVKYVPGPEYIDVQWVRDDLPQNTVFSKFSRDGRSMAQLANTHGDMGPERPFRRC